MEIAGGTRMAETFIDLGAGYFLYENRHFEPSTCVMDSLDKEPDHLFGPAAWRGERGPHGGKLVCEAFPTRIGHYDQVSEHEWKWCMPDGSELDEEPPSWPRRVVVAEAAELKALQMLDGVEFADEAALTLAVKDALLSEERTGLAATSARGRLEALEFAHPHLFAAEPTARCAECHCPIQSPVNQVAN